MSSDTTARNFIINLFTGRFHTHYNITESRNILDLRPTKGNLSAPECLQRKGSDQHPIKGKQDDFLSIFPGEGSRGGGYSHFLGLKAQKSGTPRAEGVMFIFNSLDGGNVVQSLVGQNVYRERDFSQVKFNNIKHISTCVQQEYPTIYSWKQTYPLNWSTFKSNQCTRNVHAHYICTQHGNAYQLP